MEHITKKELWDNSYSIYRYTKRGFRGGNAIMDINDISDGFHSYTRLEKDRVIRITYIAIVSGDSVCVINATLTNHRKMMECFKSNIEMCPIELFKLLTL